MTTDLHLDAIDLSHREALAVHHLLTCSALSTCAGTPDRIMLTGDQRLIVHDLADWGWSSGELTLIRVLAHLVGHGPMPDLAAVDGHERRIVRECMDTLRAVTP